MKKFGVIIAVVIIAITICAVVLLRKDDNSVNINYEIIDDANSIEGTKSKEKRGHEVVKKDDGYYLIIYGGEQPTTDTIEILDVDIKGKNVKVTVKIEQGMGDAFSYPTAVIKFDREPNKVRVIYK